MLKHFAVILLVHAQVPHHSVLRGTSCSSEGKESNIILHKLTQALEDSTAITRAAALPQPLSISFY
jgi:hypothetical protein